MKKRILEIAALLALSVAVPVLLLSTIAKADAPAGSQASTHLARPAS